MQNKLLPAFLLTLLSLAACTSADKVPVERLDRVIAAGNPDSILSADYRPGAEAVCALFANIQEATDSQLVVATSAMAENDALTLFQSDIDSRLGDLAKVESQLGSFREKAAKELPGLNFPTHIYGIATPYYQSVMTVDSVMLIGLNHYLGDDYPGYEGFGKEAARLKRKQRMAIDAAEALIRRDYPFEANDSTTLMQRMLYDGAVNIALSLTLPDASLSDILGISDDTMRGIKRFERQIWHELIERGLLFSTDEFTTDALFKPAAVSTPLGHNCPGRAVRYLAFEIVKRYLDNNNGFHDISRCLSADFYNDEQTLAKSGYNP